MASNNQYPYPDAWSTSLWEDETVNKTENTLRRNLRYRYSTSPTSSRRLYLYGSDDADRRVDSRLEQRGIVRPQQHGWMQSSIFSEPKMLISTDKSGNFGIREDTLIQISAITWKLVIVGIAGPYRCGKSFLMNRLVGKSKGFFVGNTTDAATKGIWAWCKIHPKQKETVLLLLDTEGLGDIRKGDKNHDNKLLTLITLLCNVLVFNMMGRFDQDSISKLSFATQISKWVKFGSDPSKLNNLPIVMPELILCLRDFFLKYEHGIHSPDEYFEDCLKDVRGQYEYNAPRQSLKTFFPVRHCFTFPLPADEELMDRLEDIGEDNLKKSFLQRVEGFNEHIFSCEPKQMYDSGFAVTANIDGSIFKSLLEYYVDCTRKGIIPDIENAFFIAARKENEKIMKEIKDEFKAMISGIRLPVGSLKDVQDKVITAMMKCLEMCRERMKMDKDNKQEKQLQKELEKIWDDKKTENSKLLQKQIVDNLMKRYSGIFKETKSAFARENGYQEYKKEINRMRMDFEKSLDKSSQSEFTLAWSVFMEIIRDDEMHVLETDSKVTKEERERQIRKLTDDHEKAMKEQERQRKILDAKVKRMGELQKERDAAHERQLNEIIGQLNKYRGLGVWDRFKFLVTGSVKD